MSDNGITDDDRAVIDAHVAVLLKTAPMPMPTPEQINVLRRWFGPTADRGHRTRRAA